MNRKKMRNGEIGIIGVLKSVCVNILVIAGLCAIVSCLISKEIIREEWMKYAGMIILALSGICGAELMHKSNENRIWLPIITGIVVFILLTIIHIILFSGPMKNILEITAATLIGNGIAIMIKTGRGRGKKRTRIKHSR